MSGRPAGFVVTLEQDIGSEESERLLAAIACIRGVLTVKPIGASLEGQIAEDRVRWEMWGKMKEVLE